MPEYLPIVETRKGIDQLHAYDLHVGTLVVNKLFPGTVTDAFFKRRLEQQQAYRKQIDTEFPDQVKLEQLLLSRDINTLESLQIISRNFEKLLKQPPERFV